MIIRPIGHSDLDALQLIAAESGAGFTSLVDDREFLSQKIQLSQESFARKVASPGEESYLFVLEDPATGEIMGTTGIQASVGLSNPLYHYHQSQVVHHSRDLGLSNRMTVLNMCNHYTGCSEVCTLYLRPEHRRPNAGKFLSKVRFLFMAQHPERFANTVIAEMRGVSSEAGRSPFWGWFQKNFVDLEFAEVTRMVGAGENRFIAELMPKHPLYTHLMSREAQQVIGQVHPQTQPALAMLEKEGFRCKGFVDLFDGGPTVEAELSQIRSIAQSVECEIEVIDKSSAWYQHGQQYETVSAEKRAFYMLSNTACGEFRATLTKEARYLPQRNVLQVPESIFAQLNIAQGGRVRFTQLSSGASKSHSYRQPVKCSRPKEKLYAL